MKLKIGEYEMDTEKARARIRIGGTLCGPLTQIGTLFIPEEGDWWVVRWGWTGRPQSWAVMDPYTCLEMYGEYLTAEQNKWLAEVAAGF